MRSHSYCLFYIGQSLLVDFDLCAPSRLVFVDIGQSLLVELGLCAPTRFVFFDIDQSLLVDFGLCASTCFLQVVINSVLFSSSCHQQCLVFFKLFPTVSCFLQVVTNSV